MESREGFFSFSRGPIISNKELPCNAKRPNQSGFNFFSVLSIIVTTPNFCFCIRVTINLIGHMATLTLDLEEDHGSFLHLILTQLLHITIDSNLNYEQPVLLAHVRGFIGRRLLGRRPKEKVVKKNTSEDGCVLYWTQISKSGALGVTARWRFLFAMEFQHS